MTRPSFSLQRMLADLSVEGVNCPFPCTYFGDGLPEEGMSPADYYCRDDGD